MNEQENTLIARIEEKMSAISEKSKAGMISEDRLKSEIEGLKNQIGTLDNSALVGELKSALENLNKEFTSLKETRVERKSFTNELGEAAEAISKAFVDMKPTRVVLKTVGDMLTSTNVTGTGARPVELMPMAEIKLPVPIGLQLSNVFQTSTTQTIDVSQAAEEGGAAASSEGSAKTQYDFNINGTSYNHTFVQSYLTVSREMMQDIPYLQSFIQSRLMKKVMDKASSYILEGSGSAPIWKGVKEFATAWAAGSFANVYSAPNLYHVLIIGVAQCRNNNYEPNGITLNPLDYAGLQLAVIEKQMNLPEAIVSGGTLFVSGVPVYASSQVTSDAFYIGDWMYSNTAISSGFELFIDPYTGLKNNKVTILGEMRGIHFVQAADTGAFIKGDISDAIAALTTAS